MPIETPWEERQLSPKRKLRGWNRLRKWAIQRVEEGQAVAFVCRVLAVSRSFYYKWHKRWRDASRVMQSTSLAAIACGRIDPTVHYHAARTSPLDGCSSGDLPRRRCGPCNPAKARRRA